MKFCDFEYDNIRLSDMGFVVCVIGNDGMESISNGSQLNFNTISVMHGSKFELLETNYSEALEATFQICKNPCKKGYAEFITLSEYREIVKWLCRKNFHKFKILSDEYNDFYFEASFNISPIKQAGEIYAIELNMTTNRPYALKEPVIKYLKYSSADTKNYVFNESDEEGFIYPDVEITINSDGDLIIENDKEDNNVIIKNCKSGEIINMKYPIIISSDDTHNISKDFNWNFLKIINNYTDMFNYYNVSIPCTIRIEYSPVVKLAL